MNQTDTKMSFNKTPQPKFVRKPVGTLDKSKVEFAVPFMRHNPSEAVITNNKKRQLSAIRPSRESESHYSRTRNSLPSNQGMSRQKELKHTQSVQHTSTSKKLVS